MKNRKKKKYLVFTPSFVTPVGSSWTEQYTEYMLRSVAQV